ncbi:MAG TPA: DEAD/DEAH box helicase [Nocardioidaceae bacterium]|nr:DEAD/DEAH box helicase [Nocardioidaceae bacterium]
MTAQAFAPTTPEWVSRISDEDLSRELGVATFMRGAAYHRSGAVGSLSASTGGVLVGGVRGSRGRRYHTIVNAPLVRGRPDPSTWTSHCSCPMTTDCKHVVAVILEARERLLVEEAPPPVPAWESAFEGLMAQRPVEPDREHLRLALHVEVAETTSSRYGSTATPALRLRPVTEGRNGGWVRTGVSWRELEYGYLRARLDPAQRDCLMAVLATARARAGGYYPAEQALGTGHLGPAVWRLLHEASRAGVALVTGNKGLKTVTLVDDPATVVLDTRRNGHDGDLTVAPRVRVPGHDVSTDCIGLLGSPPHGLYAQVAGDLVLARFDPPLDDSLGALVAGGNTVRVPASDAPRFLSVYYPSLRQRAAVESSDDSVEFPEILPPRLVLSVQLEEDHQTLLRWAFAYRVGDDDVDVPVWEASQGPVRDRTAEAALLDGLDVLDAVPGLRVDGPGATRRLVPEKRLHGMATATFVGDVLPALSARDDVEVRLEGTPLSYAEAEGAPLIAVSASDSSGDAAEDWFDLGITVTIDDQDVPFTPLFQALARGEEHLILDSGTWFSLDRPELQALRRLIEEARALQDRSSETLRVTRWHAGLWEELVSLGVVEHQCERWSRTVGALLDLESIPRPELPAGLNAQLRPYQEEGFHWLSFLWDHQLGGILADDMGLGKTLQTLAMAARAREQGVLTPDSPMLIVAPTSVVATWEREAARFCPDLQVATVTETRRRSGQPLGAAIAGAHLVVTSYALLRLDEEAFREHTWCGLVLDEAQFVKNHQAKTYQAARRLPAPFKLAITGTPLENSLMDLWSLLSIVAPGLFPHPQRFTELYRGPIESGAAPELLGALRRRIRPLMLRRTKEEVVRDLPPKIEQVLSVTLNPQHRRRYQTHLQRERQRVLGMLDDVNRNRIAILRSLTVLRQLSLDVSLVDKDSGARVRSSKIDALMEQVHELSAEGHRALVFSQFTGFLRLVRERLDAEGIDYVYLDGRTRDRPARIAQFRDGDAPVFLISLKAGGSGLTLTEADYVFVLDPWWNPATEAQAVDRAHRIGQDKTVMVYRLVAEGTIEEKVIELQQRKRDLFTRVVDADGAMAAPLSAEDIRGLLTG